MDVKAIRARCDRWPQDIGQANDDLSACLDQIEVLEKALARSESENKRLREAAEYLETHATDINTAFDDAERYAPHDDDAAYWRHQKKALAEVLGAALNPEVKP